MRAVNHLAINIDHDQIRGGDFVKPQPKSIQQVGIGVAGHTGRDMGPDNVIPAALRGKSIGGRQITTLFSFSQGSHRFRA